ncbi:MAG: HupE / UreJ protein [Chitinophagaceae bacterium BSSC1]|nr:MAG: HupE / UreJ protein [Chitinophagaceae bacterium BSSC1]
MNDFKLYLETGFQHIANWNGQLSFWSQLAGLTTSDHILFIIALTIRYQFADWKKVLVLVTAFTIGHSITLALSVLNIVTYSVNWIEFLIPITILITAISNLFVKKFVFKTKFPPIYFMALFFGLIHGLGFSSYLKSLLGKDQGIFSQLLAFNLGLELGQILIVLIILIISFVFVGLIKVNRREWLLFVSAAVFALALNMALDRLHNVLPQ